MSERILHDIELCMIAGFTSSTLVLIDHELAGDSDHMYANRFHILALGIPPWLIKQCLHEFGKVIFHKTAIQAGKPIKLGEKLSWWILDRLVSAAHLQVRSLCTILSFTTCQFLVMLMV